MLACSELKKGLLLVPQNAVKYLRFVIRRSTMKTYTSSYVPTRREAGDVLTVLKEALQLPSLTAMHLVVMKSQLLALKLAVPLAPLYVRSLYKLLAF